MKIIKNLLCTVALCALSVQYANAVPAYPGVIRAHQSDGTELAIIKRGDEYFHQTFTADGYPLVYNAQTRNFEYAQLANGVMRSSGIVAANEAQRTAEAREFLATVNLSDVNQYYKTQSAAARSASNVQNTGVQRVSSSAIKNMRTSSIPTTGQRKVLIILVQFSDCSFTTMTDAKQHYEDAFNTEGYTDDYGTPGSVKDFYRTSSNDLYQPEFVIAGPYTMPNTVEYYGANATSTSRVADMIVTACEDADDEVDFSEFDTDGDGTVDNVYIIYAGYGEADSGIENTIWPHSSTIYYKYKSLDGVYLGHYACSQEINGQNGAYTGCGVFVHEFGHVLGFADHYNTEDAYATYTPGMWDTMDQGSYNHNGYVPPYYSAFERASLGWLEPEELSLSTTTEVTVPNLVNDHRALFVSSTKNPDTEFFVLENRQPIGFDSYLPGHGLLVWHIHYNKFSWSYNTVNNDESHPRVYVEAANSEYPPYGGATFPGNDDIHTRSFDTWSNGNLFSIADVQENDQVVTIRLGGSAAGLGAPTNVTINPITGTTATISWDKVDAATGYQLKVVPEGGSATDTLVYDNLTATEQMVTGLTAQTKYLVYVYTLYNTYHSDAATNNFTTTELTFTETSVNALDATNITSNSFQANWEALDGATSYLVTLYNSSFTGSSEQVGNFNDEEIPENWSTNSTTFNTTHYGTAAPSLRLAPRTEWLRMDVASPSKALGLKAWYYMPKSNSVLVVQTSDDGETWTNVATATSNGQAAQGDWTFDEASYVRVLFSGSNTYLYLDDVTLVYRDWEYSAIGDPVSTTNTYYQFTNLNPSTNYAFGVVAVQGSDESLPSNNVVVTTLAADPSAINDVNADVAGEAQYFDLTGRSVNIATAPQGIYIVKQNGKTKKIMKK
ncbi:MAG: M6 family metalloprotease domain-containing protein [Prevotella sp.]|jgi:M6 family metalloprotease-like protein